MSRQEQASVSLERDSHDASIGFIAYPEITLTRGAVVALDSTGRGRATKLQGHAIREFHTAAIG